MQPKNPDYRKAIEHGFSAAAFVNDIGIKLIDCGPGWCESRIDISARHLQHGGIVHAGVQATIADHTAGAAATTLLALGEFVVTVDFDIHLLRPASGDALVCRAQVLKPGVAVSVVEAEVFALAAAERSLVSKLTATMSVRTANRRSPI
jgi:uncharacterized protein (TIGR00369 family)